MPTALRTLIAFALLSLGSQAKADLIQGYDSRACNAEGRCVRIKADKADLSLDHSFTSFQSLQMEVYDSAGHLESKTRRAAAYFDRELNILVLGADERHPEQVFNQDQMTFGEI